MNETGRGLLCAALGLTLAAGCAVGGQDRDAGAGGPDVTTASDGGTPCPSGQTRCGLACVDTSSDDDHCGSCGFACPSGQSCTAGECGEIRCTVPERNCGGSCVDITSDPMHCGGCMMPCGAGEECVERTCQSPCPSGTPTRCGGSCVDTTTDDAHCGECDNACEAPETCQDGACTHPCAATPETPDWCGDACVDTATDDLHCGACDNACDTGDVCEEGSCVIDCGAMTRCGTECVDTTSSHDHCGGCDMPCASTEACVDGACSDAVVSCGGYLYPERVTVPSTSCTGGFTSCTGSREFLVVGCHSSNPGDICPTGYDVASLMLIGQWAEAADITRYESSSTNSVCAWAFGHVAETVCGGGRVANSYCWPRGSACAPGCGTNCCPPSGPCTTSGSSDLPVPLLCVAPP